MSTSDSSSSSDGERVDHRTTTRKIEDSKLSVTKSKGIIGIVSLPAQI